MERLRGRDIRKKLVTLDVLVTLATVSVACGTERSQNNAPILTPNASERAREDQERSDGGMDIMINDLLFSN